MKFFFDSWSIKHDAEKYSEDFYSSLLIKTNESNNPLHLGQTIINLLHWKDGKVSKSNRGNLMVNGIRYQLRKTKPNTYNPEKLDEVLLSDAFFTWACGIRNDKNFCPEHLEALRGSPLWQTLNLKFYRT